MGIKQHNTKYDIVGITSSALCLVHCIASPLLLLLGYHFFEPDGWHLWDFAFLAISAFAVYSVSKGHTTKWIKAGLWASFAVLSVSILLQHDNFVFLVTSWCAAASLIVFHIFNIRHCHTCAVGK
jgi:hypothetical protein